MPFRRQNSAIFLLTAFFVGSLLSPFAHYVFMGFSDVYSSPHQSSHHVSEHHAAYRNGSFLQPVDLHLVCNYADLFATFAATAQGDVEPVDITPLWEKYRLRTTEPLLCFTYNFSLSRAPPLA